MTNTFHNRLFLPTGVEHSVTAHFISEESTNLIVARRSVLQIYSLRADLKVFETSLHILIILSLDKIQKIEKPALT